MGYKEDVMNEVTCTRLLAWDGAHRVPRQGGKCEKLHGHRYTAEITCQAELSDTGMVVDFGVVKALVGGWIDAKWDHGTLVAEDDTELLDWLRANDQKWYVVSTPTAEVMAEVLYGVASGLLEDHRLRVVCVRVYETVNCWAECRRG